MLEELIAKGSNTKSAVQNISQCLFEMEVQMHIIHLQAVYRSLETHLATGYLYEKLGDLNDSLVESSYAKTGLLDAYKDIKIKNNFNPLPLVREELAKIEKERDRIKEGYIQQIVDTIIETFANTVYKLEQLQ